MDRFIFLIFGLIWFTLLYLNRPTIRTQEEFVELLSREDHTEGWINRGEYGVFERAADDLGLKFAYGRIQEETGKQHYFKVK